MSNKDTAMTIVIDDMLKKKAKVNALMSNMTLRQYIAHLIEEDCKKNNKKKFIIFLDKAILLWYNNDNIFNDDQMQWRESVIC